MKELNIYLAGAMSGLTFEEMNNWREKMKEMLINCGDNYECKINACNPVDYYNFTCKRQQSDKEIMDFDLSMVKKSDLVIVDLNGLNESIGTSIELYEAKKSCIPVIALNRGWSSSYKDLHPWIKECITRVESNFSDAKDYIRDFYMS